MGAEVHGERVVLVTGAARRVGAEIARAVHATGATVVIHYRQSGEEAEALAATLTALRPGSATALQADLLGPGAAEKLVAAVVDRQGRLDGLVNNASSFFPTPLGRITEAEWDDLIGSNLKAPLFLIQAAAEALTRAGGTWSISWISMPNGPWRAIRCTPPPRPDCWA